MLHTLLGSIGQEEIKEAMLAWAMLAADTPRIAREQELAQQVRTWLRDRFDVKVDFDTPDALESLDRLELWADRARIEVVGADEAVRRLEAHWNERRTSGYHVSQVGT